MGRQSPGVDFALIGHADCWQKLFNIFRKLRDPAAPRVDDGELSQLIPWIPPRTVMRIRVDSAVSGRTAEGVYIETFITPDQLASRSYKSLIEKIRGAADVANREGARIATLGGFTSIALESESVQLESSTTVFTTGNTLTSAYIVKGVESAAEQINKNIRRSTMLVVGATGDLGSGCVRYFSQVSDRLILVAQHPGRLKALADEMSDAKADVIWSKNLAEWIDQADVVICAASLPYASIESSQFRSDALICDAGYPRNLVEGKAPHPDQLVFHGGLGLVQGQIHYEPDLAADLYEFPVPGIVHGCLLEGGLLALEDRIEPFSRGRGKIRPNRIEEIWAMAQKHGFQLAPIFDGAGPREG